MPEVLTFDAVVVGAGPAGAAAALALARAGRSVVLVERGPFPGAKNVYGGVVYGRVLDDIVPNWWEEVPVERWVVRRSTMMMTGTQSLSVDFRTDAWGSAPYNGMTTLRSHFDAWLAGKATGAGARLVASTVATGLVRDGAGRVVGVRTDRDGAELHAPVVIACDGVNSFLAKEAGLLPRAEASHHTLGVKEVLDLPHGAINERFGVQDHEGVDMEILGCTREIPGGGFLYTNADTVSIGVVVSLPQLAASGVRPEELVADLKAHPTIAPLLRGSSLREYAAHLIPEGGYDTMPALASDGMLVAAARALADVVTYALILAARHDPDAVTVDVAQYQAKRDLLCDALTAMGYDAPRPQGSYYCFPRTPIADDVAFIRRLQKEGILAVPGSGFGRGGFMRLSLTIPRQDLERSLPGFERALRQP